MPKALSLRELRTRAELRGEKRAVGRLVDRQALAAQKSVLVLRDGPPQQVAYVQRVLRDLGYPEVVFVLPERVATRTPPAP